MTASTSRASIPAQWSARRLGCEQWRVLLEAPVQRIGIELEALVERLQREGAPFDAVIVVEYSLQDGARARSDLGAIGALQRFPAIGLREAARRNRGAEAGDEHQGLCIHFIR